MIEDLQTSYLDKYEGGLRKPYTTIEYIKSSLDAFYTHEKFGRRERIFFDIHSMHCWHEICALIKKWR